MLGVFTPQKLADTEKWGPDFLENWLLNTYQSIPVHVYALSKMRKPAVLLEIHLFAMSDV